MTATIIPTVKEQVRRMTGGRSAKDTEAPQRETRNVRELTILGTVGRSTYATHGGRHFKFKGPARPEQIDQAPADAIIVLQPVRSDDGRQSLDPYIGTLVEPDMFERLHRQKTYRGPKERRPGPLDGLAELRKPADRVPVTLDSNDDGSLEAVAMGALSRRPLLLWTDSRPTPMTVRRLIEVANAAGANLRHHNGHTLADWSALRRWRPLLIAAWPLVDAHMAGRPLQCAYEHVGEAPPAATLDLVGTPVCNACVGWDDAA